MEFDAQHYRDLAQHCRERATLRRLACDRDIMLTAAEEFERLALNAELIARPDMHAAHGQAGK